MVKVRPTVRVLKLLNDGNRLPNAVAGLYKMAKGTDDPEQKLRFLEQAVRMATDCLELVTYIQKQFDHQRFEQHRELSSCAGIPVFEAREKKRSDSPAWRGAVVQGQPAGYAWLIHADIHDHFHSEAKFAITGLKTGGMLGPSGLDLKLLELAERMDNEREVQRHFLLKTLEAIEQSVALAENIVYDFRGNSPAQWLKVTVSVATSPYGEWDMGLAHEDLDMVLLRIERGRDWGFLQSFIGVCTTYLQPDEDLIEQTNTVPFMLNMALSRTRLASLFDVVSTELPTKFLESVKTDKLHYANKTSLTESFVFGKALQAVCGRWWVPIGDEATHGNLPVCDDCEREMPVAQALDNWLKG